MQKSLHTLWNIWLHNPTIVKLSVGLGVIVSASSIYIYIYIYEMGSSYTWCNFIRVTSFLSHRFPKDLTVKKKTQFFQLIN